MRCANCGKKILPTPLGNWYHKKNKAVYCSTKRAVPK